MKPFLFCLAITLVGTSCATKTLWKGYSSDTKFWVSADDVTERELINEDADYEHYYSESGPGFLVDKSASRHIGGYAWRVVATPFALGVDAVGAAASVAMLALSLAPIAPGLAVGY